MSTEDLSIRALEPEDLHDLTELLNQPRAVWGTLQLPYTSIELRRQTYPTAPQDGINLVAVINGKVIGNVSLFSMKGRRRAHAANLGMTVHDAFAGRGVGRALLSAILEQADKWLNYKRVELTVWTDNQRAIALYEQAGFEREGILRAWAWRDGGYVDALAMARLRF